MGPKFREVIGFTIAKLEERPDEAQSLMHLFLDADGRLVGSGGYATAAARAMVDKAAAGWGADGDRPHPDQRQPVDVGPEAARLRFRRGSARRRRRPCVAVASGRYCLLNDVGRTTNTTRSG